jgi:flagellar biosynthesis protein FlhF
VGPTGVGKTTTLGKLAARYVLKHGAEGLALVTTDCYRIAAYEQLRTFGRILGVTVRVVDENNALDLTIKSMRNKSLVLIDTAGLNVRDPNLQSQLTLLTSAQARIRRFIVLPAISQSRVLLDTYEAYRDAGLNGCVLTKLDEAVHIGEVLGLVLEKRLPVSYITNGQKIPDDVKLASPSSLVGRFARDVERSEENDGKTG